jgi:hypothetical protein
MRQQLTTFITAVIVRSVYPRVDARITVLVLNYQHFRFIPANAVMASLARLKAIAISIYSWVPQVDRGPGPLPRLQTRGLELQGQRSN